MSTVLADAGYWSAANAGLDLDVDLLIATSKGAKLDQQLNPDAAGQRERRQALVAAVAAVAAGTLTALEAAERLNVTRGRIYQLLTEHRRSNHDQNPPRPSALQAMQTSSPPTASSTTSGAG